MNGIFLHRANDSVRIGTIAKFVGNRPAERWVAWSVVHPANEENRQGFRRRRDALAWLQEQFTAQEARP